MGMRFAPMAVAATIALASTVSTGAVADAKEPSPDTATIKCIDGELFVKVNDVYQKIEEKGSSRTCKTGSSARIEQQQNRSSYVASWFFPLMATFLTIVSLITLWKKFFPTGKLTVYYPPIQNLLP